MDSSFLIRRTSRLSGSAIFAAGFLAIPKETSWESERPSESRYNGCVPLATRDFRIRDFQSADFETLWRVDQECFPPGISYSRTELKFYLRRRTAFALVAVSSFEHARKAAKRFNMGRPESDSSNRSSSDSSNHSSDDGNSASCGVAGFIVAEIERGAGHIITIDVVAAARRHGVGSLLLGSAEERLRVAGCSSVELETAVDNISAISFYKRHDYSVIDTFPRYYSNGVDALRLQKILPAK
ncbi:MAG: N-acetyltransferase [Candidatus Sulfotelmatobacter sp.]